MSYPVLIAALSSANPLPMEVAEVEFAEADSSSISFYNPPTSPLTPPPQDEPQEVPEVPEADGVEAVPELQPQVEEPIIHFGLSEGTCRTCAVI
jgi:hypothetical protein